MELAKQTNNRKAETEKMRTQVENLEKMMAEMILALHLRENKLVK